MSGRPWVRPHNMDTLNEWEAEVGLGRRSACGRAANPSSIPSTRNSILYTITWSEQPLHHQWTCTINTIDSYIIYIYIRGTHLGGPVPVLSAEEHLLPEDGEVRLVRGQPQHDQVGVQPVQDVPRVGVVARLTHRERERRGRQRDEHGQPSRQR